MNNNKKKKVVVPPANNRTIPGAGQMSMNNAPMGGQQVQPNRFNDEGAGETSVLNEGAAETTVLGGGSGATLLRKSNGDRITLNKSEFSIGKERRRVDYCIADNSSVSRVHAVIKFRAGRYFITDMNSTNCTFVNGSKLAPNQEVALNRGDKIKISDEEFEFLG